MDGYADGAIKHNNLTLKVREPECLIYEIPGETGTMTCYDVFPGVQLCFNEFSTSVSLPVQDNEPNLMEINYCRRGSHECEYLDNTYSFLGEGDLVINMLCHSPRESRFPLGYYEGIGLFIDVNRAAQAVPHFLEGVQIDLPALCRKLHLQTSSFYLPSNSLVNHIFTELYDADPQIRIGYFKIKALELLLFLSRDQILNKQREQRYYPKPVVEAVKAVKRQITQQYQEHITVEQLAQAYSISTSTLKNCFRDMYGKPVYTYLRQYRMQVAAGLLQNSQYSIAFIANYVGYESAGKFTAAFKSVLGCIPSEYRKR